MCPGLRVGMQDWVGNLGVSRDNGKRARSLTIGNQRRVFMKRLKRLMTVLFATALILVFVTPIGPLPGFFIGGKSTPTPAVWADTSQVDEISLRVPGVLPRVVIIWVVQVEGQLYVVGSKDSGWVKRIGQGALVEMRLKDRRYSLNATPVTTGFTAIIEAYTDKYRPDYPDIVAGFPSVDESQDAFGVFRLDSRSS